MSMKIGKCIKSKVIEPRYVMKITYMHGDADGYTETEYSVRKGEERVFEKLYAIMKKAEFEKSRDNMDAARAIAEDDELVNWFFPHEKVKEEKRIDWCYDIVASELGWGHDITDGSFSYDAKIDEINLKYIDENNAEYYLTVE